MGHRVKALFVAWQLKNYLIALAAVAALLAVVGGYGYHRGAISQAEEVGRLNGKIGELGAEITRLKADVAEADAKTLTCQNKIGEQNAAIAQWKAEADQRIRDAAKAAAAARATAQTYKDRAKKLSQQTPSKSCAEASARFIERLRREREGKQ